MNDHPIPQDVTGYRFHIVGNMTLGQFMQLAAGAVLAFLIYSTNLYDIVKWPLIIFVFGLGAMAAFIPIAERPISHWVTTFFRILYRPTQFFWRKESEIPDFFTFVSSSAQKVVLPELDLTPLRRQKIHEYIASAKVTDAPDEESQQVQNYVEYVSTLFSVQPAYEQTQTQEVVAQKPRLKVRLRGMRQQPQAMDEPSVSPLPPDFTAAEASVPQADAPPALDQASLPAEPLTYTTDAIIEAQAHMSAQAAADEAAPAETEAVATTADSDAQTSALQAPPMQQMREQTAPAASTEARFNAQLPFPSKPTVPNKLVGMILSNQNELIEGAIIEIHTKDGSVARAVRSNALGQFFVSTPLAKGTYVIAVEKAGRQFEPITIELKGKIVEPLEIRSL